MTERTAEGRAEDLGTAGEARPAADDADPEIARLRFELDLSLGIQARLHEEVDRLNERITGLEGRCASLGVSEATINRYVQAVHSSLSWRLMQGLRGIFGRRW